ncbi:hypothetical protein ZWY2020_054444 [Hordeum vulgare]|nr:hypothetical protein ZWY2020_054444 [Hordeum vulgare]
MIGGSPSTATSSTSSRLPARRLLQRHLHALLPEAVVGLRIHDELAIDASRMPGNQGILDFRQILTTRTAAASTPSSTRKRRRHSAKAAAACQETAASRHGGAARRRVQATAGDRVTERVARDRERGRAGARRRGPGSGDGAPAAPGHGARADVPRPERLRRDGGARRRHDALPLHAAGVGVHPGGAAGDRLGCRELLRRAGAAARPALHPYKILPSESSLFRRYARDDPVLTDPVAVNAKGWQVTKKVYLDGQNVRLDMARFRWRLLTHTITGGSGGANNRANHCSMHAPVFMLHTQFFFLLSFFPEKRS